MGCTSFFIINQVSPESVILRIVGIAFIPLLIMAFVGIIAVKIKGGSGPDDAAATSLRYEELAGKDLPTLRGGLHCCRTNRAPLGRCTPAMPAERIEMRSMCLLISGIMCFLRCLFYAHLRQQISANGKAAVVGDKETLDFAESGSLTLSVRQVGQDGFIHGTIRGKYKFVTDKKIEVVRCGKAAIKEAR